MKTQKIKLNLEDLTKERQALPAQIAQAATSADIAGLTALRKRQVEIESEIFAASVNARQCEIEALEAQKADAAERARQAVDQRSKQLPVLDQEMISAKKRVQEIPAEIRKLHNTANDTQREVSALDEKIRQSKQALADYIEQSSAAPVRAAA